MRSWRRLQRPRGRLCAIIGTSAPHEATAISFFLLKRFATFVATLLAASVVVFAVLDLLPGNAAEVMLGDSATPESLAALTAKLGLDRPALVRYADWIGGLLRPASSASASPTTRRPPQLIAERLQVTAAAGADGDGADGGDRASRSASSRRRATTAPATSA